MPSSYPAGFDTFAAPGANLSSTPTHSNQHQNEGDAIEAIQAELGLNPRGSSASVAARLSGGLGTIGAWSTWTPVVTQLGAVTVTVAQARWYRAGRLITFHTALTVTGSGTATNQVTMSLPVTSAASGFVMGSGLIFDVSASRNYTGMTYLASTTTAALVPNDANGVLGAVGGFTAALAASDLIQMSGTYEAAS